jgi:hypothetical protein
MRWNDDWNRLEIDICFRGVQALLPYVSDRRIWSPLVYWQKIRGLVVDTPCPFFWRYEEQIRHFCFA